MTDTREAGGAGPRAARRIVNRPYPRKVRTTLFVVDPSAVATAETTRAMCVAEILDSSDVLFGSPLGGDPQHALSG